MCCCLFTIIYYLSLLLTFQHIIVARKIFSHPHEVLRLQREQSHVNDISHISTCIVVWLDTKNCSNDFLMFATASKRRLRASKAVSMGKSWANNFYIEGSSSQIVVIDMLGRRIGKKIVWKIEGKKFKVIITFSFVCRLESIKNRRSRLWKKVENLTNVVGELKFEKYDIIDLKALKIFFWMTFLFFRLLNCFSPWRYQDGKMRMKMLEKEINFVKWNPFLRFEGYDATLLQLHINSHVQEPDTLARISIYQRQRFSITSSLEKSLFFII